MLIRTAPATSNIGNPWCFPIFPAEFPSTGLEAEIQVEGPCLGLGLTSAMQRIDLEGATLLAYGICQRSGKGSWEQSVVCTSCRTALLLNHGTSAKQQFFIGPNEACDEGRHQYYGHAIRMLKPELLTNSMDLAGL